jgi:serine phosphatase RsbU (regulator of sigma subunit)
MELQIAVSKIRKYATSSSGDTVEVVERPNGGLSIVMADGQSSGRGAKWISTMVVRKVIALLAEGVRDGAAARAASDSLFTERKGKVSSTLNILSVDMQTQSLVITRNNPAPVLLAYDGKLHELSDNSLPVGLYRDTRPQIFEKKLQVGLTAIAYTDGLVHAGSRSSSALDVPGVLSEMIKDSDQSAQVIADSLLEQALNLDQGRPVDDTSIAVLRVLKQGSDNVRRMVVRIPLEPQYY